MFAGIGGFRLGLDYVGAECVFSSESNKSAQLIYRKNFGEMPQGDISKIEASAIPGHDILCAGFPCQSFSISGKQKGFDDVRGTLFFEIARIVEHHQPKMLLLENVKNFEKHDNGNTLYTVKSILDNLGYNIYHQILNASDFGLPQSRKRIFIVGFRKDLKLNIFNFPTPKNIETILKDKLISTKEANKYIINRADTFFKTNYHISEKASIPIRIGYINKGGQGERIYHENGHAITLSAHGGGVGAKTGLYYINGCVRKLAPRECARLQGFPDTFEIDTSDNQAWQQFGNAVPVNIVKAIAEKMITHYGKAGF